MGMRPACGLGVAQGEARPLQTLLAGAAADHAAKAAAMAHALRLEWRDSWQAACVSGVAQGDVRAALRTDAVSGHVWRGILGVLGMVCGFAALGLLPFPEASALGYAMPLLATGFAALLLGEVVRMYRWSAILIGIYDRDVSLGLQVGHIELEELRIQAKVT